MTPKEMAGRRFFIYAALMTAAGWALAACSSNGSDKKPTTSLQPGSWCDPVPDDNAKTMFGRRRDGSYVLDIPGGGDSGSGANEMAACLEAVTGKKIPVEERSRIAAEIEALNPGAFIAQPPESTNPNRRVDPRIPSVQLTLPDKMVNGFLGNPAPPASPPPTGSHKDKSSGNSVISKSTAESPSPLPVNPVIAWAIAQAAKVHPSLGDWVTLGIAAGGPANVLRPGNWIDRARAVGQGRLRTPSQFVGSLLSSYLWGVVQGPIPALRFIGEAIYYPAVTIHAILSAGRHPELTPQAGDALYKAVQHATETITDMAAKPHTLRPDSAQQLREDLVRQISADLPDGADPATAHSLADDALRTAKYILTARRSVRQGKIRGSETRARIAQNDRDAQIAAVAAATDSETAERYREHLETGRTEL